MHIISELLKIFRIRFADIVYVYIKTTSIKHPAGFIYSPPVLNLIMTASLPITRQEVTNFVTFLGKA